MIPTDCLNSEQLRDFSLGLLLEPDHRRASDHLRHCPACQEVLAECDGAADSVMRILRGVSQADDVSPLAEDPDYQRAVVRARRSGPAAETSRAPDVEQLTTLRDYRLVRRLGSGGMGTVYQAIHTRLDRIVAVKVLPTDRMRDETAVARFQREMRAVGSLNHPAIVRATDAGELDGTHFLVMDFVEGYDLATVSRALGPLPIADACELIRQAADGLDHVHARGMVHRDVKPSNLMLTPAGEVRILDLGLALLGEDAAAGDERTTVGQFLGTLDYMAPEQIDDSHQVDSRADIYSLGATLYHLLAGVAPYGGPEFDRPLRKFRAIALSPVPPLHSRRPDVPRGLSELIDRMLAKSPDERCQRAAEVADSLRTYTTGHDLPRLLSLARVAHPEPCAGDLPPRPPAPKSEMVPNGAPGGQRRLRFSLLAAAAFLLTTLACGFAVRVLTNRGELVVRSPARDITLLVRRSGKTVDDWELERGENRTLLRSGNYELVLLGQANGLTIHHGTFVLTRGDQHVATIERTAAGGQEESYASTTEQQARTESPNLLGKTWKQWADALREADESETITLVLTAMANMPPPSDEDGSDLAELIIQKIRPFGLSSGPVGERDRPKTARVRDNAVRALIVVGLPDPVNVYIPLLERDDSCARSYALSALARSTHDLRSSLQDPESVAPLVRALIAASRDLQPTVRRVALGYLTSLAPEDPDVQKRLHEALDDPDLEVVHIAARELFALDPKDRKELSPALLRLLRDDPMTHLYRPNHSTPDSQPWRAFEMLRTIDPDSPELLELLVRYITSPGRGLTRPATGASELRARALLSLAELRSHAAPAIPALLKLIRLRKGPDSNPLNALGSSMLRERVQVEDPQRRLRDTSTSELAVRVLRSIGKAADQPQVVELLQELKLYVLSLLRDEPMSPYVPPNVSELLQTVDSALKHIHGEIPPLPIDAKQDGASPGTAAEPTYGGKTFSQWVDVLSTDRQRERIYEAIEGIVALAKGGREAEAIRLILENAEKYGPAFGRAPSRSDPDLRSFAARTLEALYSAQTAPVFAQALLQGRSAAQA